MAAEANPTDALVVALARADAAERLAVKLATVLETAGIDVRNHRGWDAYATHLPRDWKEQIDAIRARTEPKP